MLMLTRRVGERIFIGENHEIVIQVCRMSGGEVKIGIEADKDIPILREEVYLRDALGSIAKNLREAFLDKE